MMAALVACGGRPERIPADFDLAGEYAKVRAAHANQSAARETLDRVMAGAPTGPAAGGVIPASVRDAQAAFDRAYAREQRALAVFLNRALNAAPGRPETRAALALYAESAVANARFLLDRGGDRARAVEILEAAQRAYRAIGLPLPTDLTATLDEARRAPALVPTPVPAAADPGRRAHHPHRHGRPRSASDRRR